MDKYFGLFSTRQDVAMEFQEGDGWRYDESFKVAPDFPTDEEIVFAVYGTPSYEGYAFVVFERDGKLYEVHGAHCSCYGLENQWEPEETTWEFLARSVSEYGYMDRTNYREYPVEAYDRWEQILMQHGV